MMGLKMPKIILTYVGVVNGVKAYAPIDAEDEAAIGDMTTIVCDVKGERAKRTIQQNKAIHKYCSLLATAFNDAGLDMKAVLAEKEAEVSWSMDSVKDVIWRPIQTALYPKKVSTTQLETDEVGKVYEQIARHMSEKFNINQSFPNRFFDYGV